MSTRGERDYDPKTSWRKIAHVRREEVEGSRVQKQKEMGRRRNQQKERQEERDEEHN